MDNDHWLDLLNSPHMLRNAFTRQWMRDFPPIGWLTELVSEQPMTAPISSKYYMEYHYGHPVTTNNIGMIVRPTT